ncbi:hypothetical protein [Vibrio mediterranei]|uniref:Transcriptional regulator n=1 Tax=Vibrio mediterranei TaxID=689 RepID=A0ABX5D640_9VIBR|nr:hypothetical protein [Vibrio mediterranei]PCD85242.1 hypothetical protein COR52_27770 [Vibrio mediterranei]PRQ64463.1 hypothetical protein COR51_27385 [Vibrio mediterranei]
MKLISSVSVATLRSHARDFKELSAFVSSNLSEILLNLPELEPERVTCLDFEVKDLSAIHQHSAVVNALFEEGLFAIMIENIELIFEVIIVVGALEPLHKSNYTAIRATGNEVLNNKIEHNFSDYLNNVLLPLKTNIEENSSAIQSVLNHEDLELSVLETFI